KTIRARPSRRQASADYGRYAAQAEAIDKTRQFDTRLNSNIKAYVCSRLGVSPFEPGQQRQNIIGFNRRPAPYAQPRRHAAISGDIVGRTLGFEKPCHGADDAPRSLIATL